MNTPGKTLFVTGIKEAISKREGLQDAVAVLVREFERTIPGVKVSSIQITRKELKTRIGTTSQHIGVLATILIDEVR